MRQSGIDVVVVAAGLVDEEVLAHAVREGRILVTLDRDFGRLAFATRSVRLPGIVYVRLRTRSPESYADVLFALLRDPDRTLELRLYARAVSRATEEAARGLLLAV